MPKASAARVADGSYAVAAALSRRPEVKAVWSATTTGDPWLRAKDGHSLLVATQLNGTQKQQEQAAPEVVAAARSAVPGLRLQASGAMLTQRAMNDAIAQDLRTAELLAAPILVLLLVFAYGSLVCALLPVVVALATVSCSLPVLALVAQFTEVSQLAVNAAAALGLGLAVDYSLFLLSRVQEETVRQMDRERALAAALRSSGRCVAFSAAAITVCLATAWTVPIPMLHGLALAGMTVAVMAALIALLVLPAVLRLLGPRLLAWDPMAPWRRARAGDDSPFWRRTATKVTARPALAGGLTVLLLALLAVPFFHVRLGLADDRALPPTAAAAQAAQHLRAEFAAPPEQILTVSVTGPHAANEAMSYRAQLIDLAHVTAVQIVRTIPAGKAAGRQHQAAAVLLVATSAAPDTQRATDLVNAIRDTSAPGNVLVGGRAAEVADTAQAVRDALPRCLTLLAAGLMFLLGLFTRTVVAPLKALAVAVISLGASLGALVVLFQDGHGRALVGDFTVTGSLDTPALLFILLVTLALSVDYEVFLLGRIREEYQRSGDNRTAIIDGVARTGRLVTCAATALVVSTAAMATSDLTLLKFIGAGIALGALVDAVLVRGVLVPAVMAALGPANWWTPINVRSSLPVTATAGKDNG
ncbi:MMPL family transporter [Streptomyces sp. SP18BB07]|uniref:MMPL family transporter n=1 Tax=Streptomyces sp. SP18BB07 TaxID=3002522 RepID=UPI002E77AEA8|nr:MMPL family transporter [Streptomyces sp. SP18BB07]MEE1757546.1 MMPL family transporter [Streptomyces sp. SP18BB07]